jgi:acyl carrier protein
MTAASDQASLISEIAAVVRQAARIPPAVPITASSRLVDDLAIDSLGVISVILLIQDHFDVAIDDEAVPNLRRVADLAAYLTARRELTRS